MKKKILISSISSDSHTWNLVYMQLLCEELGHEVVNIGNCVPLDYLIQKLHYHKPNILLISSVNGHAHIEGVEIIRTIKNHEMLRNMLTIIGGKIGTQGNNNHSHISKLLKEGFDRVFFGENSLDDFINYLDDNEKELKWGLKR